jgi:NAD(P)H-flavin reductase
MLRQACFRSCELSDYLPHVPTLEMQSHNIHRAVIEDMPDLSGHEVYASGNSLMVKAARTDFSELCRLPENAFFADAFVTEAERARATASPDALVQA